MPLQKYLKAGQKLSLRVLTDTEDAAGHLDALTGHLHALGRQTLDLTIPYQTSAEERYPFKVGMKFEIMANAMGVGIQLTGVLEKTVGNDKIRIKHNNDLQMIRRRLSPRIDTNLEVGFTRSGGKLRSFRGQWKKYVQLIEKTDDPSKLPKVPRRKTNISATGIGLFVAPPIEIADIGLFLINLEPKEKPICALAEVIWKKDREEEGRFMTGFQFLNIMDKDKKRIETFVAKGNSYVEDEEEEEDSD